MLFSKYSIASINMKVGKQMWRQFVDSAYIKKNLNSDWLLCFYVFLSF